MELIATTRPEPVAYAYGAVLNDEDGSLGCGILVVMEGHSGRVVTLRCPHTKQRFRVRLPPAPPGEGHVPYLNELLEVL